MGEKGENKQVLISRLEKALGSRLPYFNENADTLNMLSVRRMLEEDLGLEKFALDVHKRFIKQFVEKSLEEYSAKNSDSTAEVKESAKDYEKDEQLKAPSSKAEAGRKEESPIETKVEAVDVQNTIISESSIKKAILERADHFRANSKTLCLVSARRLLEEDLGLQLNALDPFKKFIRKEMEEVLGTSVASESSSIDSSKDISGNSQGNTTDASGSTEKSKSRDKHKDTVENLSGPSIKGEGQVEEDSPILGLLTRKGDLVNAQGIETSESTIKKAILDQAHHFRTNAETLTLAGSRRFLEEQLGLPENALDPYKKFISKQIQEVLDSPAADIKKAAKATETKKSNQSKRPRSPETETKSRKKLKEDASKKSTEKIDSDEGGDSSEDGGSAGKADKKNVATKSSKKLKKGASRKSTEMIDSDEGGDSSEDGGSAGKADKKNVATKSSKKLKKGASKKSTEKIESDEVGDSSEDGGSHTSAGKADKKNVATTPAYGKRVEHLKSVIKACGMSVPPIIYKKAKQVAEGQRESFVTKELEDILSKEGLSKNPTEKEIKDVKKRKERAKELEGIDLSNIVTSGRRRSVTSFAAPSHLRREDKVADKAKVNVTKNVKKTTGNTKDKDVKNDKKVELVNGDEHKDENVIKEENKEEVEVNEGGEIEAEEEVKEVEEEGEEEEDEDDDDEEEEEEEEEDSQQSDDFNEDDGDDSD